MRLSLSLFLFSAAVLVHLLITQGEEARSEARKASGAAGVCA